MGLNQAVPLEGLHVILIGYFMLLIQGLSWCHKVTGAATVARAKEEKGIHYIFSGKDRTVVNIKLKAIGFQLTHQSDPDLPTTNFSTYLIEPESKDTKFQKEGRA